MSDESVDWGGAQPALSRHGSNELEIKPIGAGCEVGRSCIVMKFRGRTVMFDCGLHPAKKRYEALPIFDSIDPKSVDVVLITHCHTDHCAALPYFVTKTSFKENSQGKIFMTPPTQKLIEALLDDSPKSSSSAAAGASAPASDASTSESTMPDTDGSSDGQKDGDSGLDEPLYSKEDTRQTLRRVTPINFNETVKLDGMSITCYNAGHILGAAMFLVEIGGRSVLYTGDYSYEEDHHLKAATIPKLPQGRKVDVLICESTFGTDVHKPRRTREERFTKLVREVVKRGGRCLVPMFAVGRTQELLLLLDEYWDRNPDLMNVPLYWVSNKAERYLQIFRTSREFMNSNVQLLKREHTHMTTKDPFDFKYIRAITQSEYVDKGPCVVIASPGMLQNGVSRYFYDLWHDNPLNGIIFAGYSVKNSFSFTLLEPSTRKEGGASVDEESFSAHADYKQTKEFIDNLNPLYTVLVHGEPHKMNMLKVELDRRYKSKMTVFTPKNNQPVQLPMPSQDGIVKIIGSLASQSKGIIDTSVDMDADSDVKPPPNKRERSSVPIDGFLIHQDSTYLMTDSSDLSRFTRLKTVEIKQIVTLPFTPSLRLLAVSLNDMFGYHGLVSSTAVCFNEDSINVFGRLHVSRKDSSTLRMEWIGGDANDILADSVSACAISLEVDPNALSRAQELDEQSQSPVDEEKRLQTVCMQVLKKHFGVAETKPGDPNMIMVNTDKLHVTLTLPTFEFTCDDSNTIDVVRGIVTMLKNTLTPMKTPGVHEEKSIDSDVKKEDVSVKEESTTEMN